MKNVIFIAPPAAGKGTISKNLVEIGYEHISTGELLRNEIYSQTYLGNQVNKLIKQGCLVDDEIVSQIVFQKLQKTNKPFILDGFPRTMNQVNILDKIFDDLKIDNYNVIYLNTSYEDALKRTLGRLTCKCGLSYNTFYKNLTPKIDNICDKCGSKLLKRDEDNKETFDKRYKTFIKNIEPIKEYYSNKNRLVIIDTNMDILKITDRIKEILK